MTQSNTGSTRVTARFEIVYTQFLDADGMPQGELPVFARDAEQLKKMYRVMVNTRLFDKKAVALQRTGQLGTYASCLGQEAVGTALGLSMQDDDAYIPAYPDHAANYPRGRPREAIPPA